MTIISRMGCFSSTSNGTNIERNDDVLNRLVNASLGLYASVANDNSKYCADLQ
jgi:hypothetical protein